MLSTKGNERTPCGELQRGSTPLMIYPFTLKTVFDRRFFKKNKTFKTSFIALQNDSAPDGENWIFSRGYVSPLNSRISYACYLISREGKNSRLQASKEKSLPRDFGSLYPKQCCMCFHTRFLYIFSFPFANSFWSLIVCKRIFVLST